MKENCEIPIENCGTCKYLKKNAEVVRVRRNELILEADKLLRLAMGLCVKAPLTSCEIMVTQSHLLDALDRSEKNI